jgi:site-specific recombinase XerD
MEKQEIISQLCDIIDESEKMTNDVMDHLDIVLEKLNEISESKNIQNDIDSIKNNIFITLESMQSQDAHRQKIERIVNTLDPNNHKFASSAKHISGDQSDDLVSPEELEALIAAAANN